MITRMDTAVVLVSVLAVWRVTHLLVGEDGPWDVFKRIRNVGKALGLERLLFCFYCASVWVAVPFAVLVTREWRALALLIPALSGGAILLERITSRDEPPVWIEGEEKST